MSDDVVKFFEIKWPELCMNDVITSKEDLTPCFVQPESRVETQPESLENAVLQILAEGPAGKAEISARLGQKRVSGQLNKVVRALLESGMIELTIPEKPKSRLQKYRIRAV